MITSVYFLPVAEPTDPAAVGEAVASYVRSSGLVLDQITLATPKVKHRKLRVASLPGLCAEPGMLSFTLWNNGDFAHNIDVFLRDTVYSRTNDLSRFYERRQGHVISTALPPMVTDELRALLVALAGSARLAHGFIAGFERFADAMAECMSSWASPRDPDPAREERLTIDGRHFHEKDKLRRLYPITIIGPDIWAALPPLPAFDPMPKVEDLGNCKVLTAWPELCEPRDPAFLRGTRALREWLWPYTIQNPADHVDNDPV